MRVALSYGRAGLEVDLPDANLVKCLGYREAEPLADPTAAVWAALASPTGAAPLAELARGRKNACVVISDVTRPVPNPVILPPILRTLEESGIPRAGILILVATGMHRPNVGDELAEMVGAETAANYRIENHDGLNRQQHADLGESPRGVPVWIDSRYVEADLKITTGLIEPHFMAGFSGGRKLICRTGALRPSQLARAEIPEHPNARSVLDVAGPRRIRDRRAGCDFIVNTTIDAQRRILKLVAGDMGRLPPRRGLRPRPGGRHVPEPVDGCDQFRGHPPTRRHQSVKEWSPADIVKPGEP